ncbi:tRNA dimethylallyltransferase-like isoform X1 [Mya arenaria]|uniref:tRNA dimethylallyltransferase-like isoform X1 n=2 Tax=Mya arenaria TaxID=6604 RepID=UPI0022E96784|nr:tRNA dimethylallyltransferase-like isoform X1 [Mya arenaria]
MAASIRNPVVVVLGATGTGKTKLSLELGKLFNGEIISADAMQLYKGLDIITNKATKEEMTICKHHMIDYISPLKENSTVHEYRNAAVPIIDSILAASKTPIIVGGSNYYIESLLWKGLIDNQDLARVAATQDQTHRQTDNKCETDLVRGKADGTSSSSSSKQAQNSSSDSESDLDLEDEALFTAENRAKYEQQTGPQLHQRLADVDPNMAARFHPNDKRKIIRALEVFDHFGVKMSTMYERQHASLADNTMGGLLRYPNTCVFWIQCETDVLDCRLDGRVDTMLEKGLVAELTDFHRQYNEDRLNQGKEADYTRGIFQSIGFKEFHNYLLMDDQQRATPQGQNAFLEGVNKLKLVTRQYARKQKRWIETRLLKRPCSENVPRVYGLDGTDVFQWDKNVHTPAVEILTAVQKGENPPIQALQHREVQREFATHYCRVCEVYATTPDMWQMHMKGRRHKKRAQSHRKRLARLSQTLDSYVKKEDREPEITNSDT